jgi:hypothetical protein
MSLIEHYRACAERGMSIKETANLHGVTERAVRLANQIHGLGFRLRPYDNTRDLAACRERLTELAAQGKSRREIAVIMRAKKSTVMRWTREWNITSPKWPRARPALAPILEREMSEAEVADFRFLRSKQYTFRDALRAIKRPDLLECL